MGSNNDHSHLKGFVIITLPPSNNPSLGKTITAFTLPNSPLPPPRTPTQSHLPVSLRTPFFTHQRRKISWTILGIALFALLTFCSIQSPQTLLKITNYGSLSEIDQNDDHDDKKVNSFIFPLFPKFGFGEMYKMRDMEVKLGKFSMFGSKSAVLPVDDGGLLPSKIKASISAVLPVNGDEIRDGYELLFNKKTLNELFFYYYGYDAMT